MTKAQASRKRLFRAALAIAGMTAEQWGQKEGVTSGHLSMILAGKRTNEDIEARIEAFTTKHLSRTVALAS